MKPATPAVRQRRAAPRLAVEARIARDLNEGKLPRGVDPGALARFYALVLQGLSVQAVDGASRKALPATAATALSAWPKEP